MPTSIGGGVDSDVGGGAVGDGSEVGVSGGWVGLDVVSSVVSDGPVTVLSTSDPPNTTTPPATTAVPVRTAAAVPRASGVRQNGARAVRRRMRATASGR